MAFNPNAYKNLVINAGKPLPVILLLDVSGSMSGEKIENLHKAVVNMIDSFVDAITKETIIEVAIITFGRSVDLITYDSEASKAYVPVKDFQKQGVPQFVASGMTPLGVAIKMAKDIIEDREMTPSKSYKPAVVLVSDGEPNDEWEQPLVDFTNTGRSRKAQRLAVAIGDDVNMDVLERFTNNRDLIFKASEASNIENAFKKATMSITSRTTSNNPDNFEIQNKESESPQKSVNENVNSNSSNDIDDEDDCF